MPTAQLDTLQKERETGGRGVVVGLRRTSGAGGVAPDATGACSAASCSSSLSLSMRGDMGHPIGSLRLDEEPKETKQTPLSDAGVVESTPGVQKLSCPTNRYFRVL